MYTVATLAVIQDVESGFQSFFRKHAHEIVAITLHKNGELVATADNGNTGTIYVWSSVTMETMMRLHAEPSNFVVSMCFSSDARRLIVVSEQIDSMIEIFDW